MNEILTLKECVEQARVIDIEEREHIDKLSKLPEDLISDSEKGMLKIAKALANNQVLIDLDEAIKVGKLFKRSRLPRIAIGNVEAALKEERIAAGTNNNDYLCYGVGRPWPATIWRSPTIKIRSMGNRMGLVTTPIPPPELRTQVELDDLIVFEVEKYDVLTISQVDPYVIRKVAGNIYSIVASWDLSDAEICVYQQSRVWNI